MVGEIFGLAGIEPDVTLYAGDRHARLNERVAAVMRRFEDFVCEVFGDGPADGKHLEAALRGEYPLAIAVHGDTSSAMAAALAAFHMHIPVFHVEAGLRTGGLNLTPFPEELNRQVITCIAALHLAPTPGNLQNLVRENVPVDQVFVTGNTGIDALRWASGLDVPFRDPAVAAAVEGPERIVVVTAHRRESWGGGLRGIATGVARLAEGHPETRFVVPMHPNPAVRDQLRRAARRARERPAHRAAALRRIRPPARPLPPGHHRLRAASRRRPRRSASRCWSPARRPSAPRGWPPGRCSWSAPTPIGSPMRATGCSPTTRPTRGWPTRTTPTATGAPPSGSSRRSSTSSAAARRRRRSATATRAGP